MYIYIEHTLSYLDSSTKYLSYLDSSTFTFFVFSARVAPFSTSEEPCKEQCSPCKYPRAIETAKQLLELRCEGVLDFTEILFVYLLMGSFYLSCVCLFSTVCFYCAFIFWPCLFWCVCVCVFFLLFLVGFRGIDSFPTHFFDGNPPGKTLQWMYPLQPQKQTWNLINSEGLEDHSPFQMGSC